MTKTIASKTSNPTYVQICTAIEADLRAAGVQLVPQPIVDDAGFMGNKNWACFQSGQTQQKIYVERNGKHIHTTLEMDPATPGYIAPKDNGKIAAHFATDLDLVRAHLVPLFIGTAAPLRAAKAPVRKSDSATASGQAPLPVGQEYGGLLPEDVQALNG